MLRKHAEDGNAFLDVIVERIVDQLSSGRVTVKKISSDLGTSKRTISKHLIEHGT